MSEKNELLKELKKAGLNIGEDAVEAVVEAVFKAIPVHLAKKNHPVAPIVAGILPILKPFVLEMVDKIYVEEDAKKSKK